MENIETLEIEEYIGGDNSVVSFIQKNVFFVILMVVILMLVVYKLIINKIDTTTIVDNIKSYNTNIFEVTKKYIGKLWLGTKIDGDAIRVKSDDEDYIGNAIEKINVMHI